MNGVFHVRKSPYNERNADSIVQFSKSEGQLERECATSELKTHTLIQYIQAKRARMQRMGWCASTAASHRTDLCLYRSQDKLVVGPGWGGLGFEHAQQTSAMLALHRCVDDANVGPQSHNVARNVDLQSHLSTCVVCVAFLCAEVHLRGPRLYLAMEIPDETEIGDILPNIAGSRRV